ncbi:hypothetical protein EZV73_26795 [Acidaminobacter sp. JC074]|uniref:DUF2326 domain-containing protein n=1 Tax=Acidaminobacter sp. JC074 TaxID=2530199 RepID=UPI001F0F731F|nr:DUF2326 domain-containing protein [Acidaminobacter sp. JC074]MCH4891216.1 hypothetical protein [Acidaminobacter sp. JC074]
MLKQINCNIFREKTINFHKGLNSVLGDEKGSNSIGKSTLLMIIDFIYGGNSYIKENDDVVKHLGHHIFEFELSINNISYYYRRGTENPDTIDICNSSYKKIDDFNLSAYTQKLKEFYLNENNFISFRSVVGTFSRIAQKRNKFDSKPLKIVVNSKEKDCLDNLIKLFGQYSIINETQKDIKDITKEIQAITSANKYDYINKINATTYKKNLKRIAEENKQVEKLSLEMSLQLKDYDLDNKNKLYYEVNEAKKERELLKSKIRRLEDNLSNNSKAITENFTSLIEFFPMVNIDKLKSIEQFHNSITKVLSDDMRSELDLLMIEKNKLDVHIDTLEKKVIINNVEGVVPSLVLEPLSKLIISTNNMKEENRIYLRSVRKNEDKKKSTEKLQQDTLTILSSIQDEINAQMEIINHDIYKDNLNSPKLDLSSNNHSLHLEDNTGTGRSDSNLVIFDVSILKLTSLPFIIHDSIMFKNIGNIPMKEIINLYSTQNKQCFIAIDEIQTYGEKTAKLLKSSKVAELSSDKVLFTLDWSGNSKS